MLKDIEKLYFSIGEVAEILNIDAPTLRYWEKEFLIVQLGRTQGGHRLYTKKEIETFKQIQYLIKGKKYTLQGAKEALEKERAKIKEDITLRECLLNLKKYLTNLEKSL